MFLAKFSTVLNSLAVGVIPEALPLVTTFSLTQGALKLAKEGGCERLSAIEDLGVFKYFVVIKQNFNPE